MSSVLFINQPQVFVGLGTLTNTIATAGLYNVQVQFTENPPSGISVTVTQNGSTVFTAPTLTPTQIAQQFKAGLVCAATDVINVVLASSSAIDNQLNTVKSTITLGQGM